MALGKRTTKAREGVDREHLYTLEEAVKMVKERAKAKFDETIEIAMNLGVDPRHATLELSFAPSLAADMIQTLDYLVEYPYGCAEQTMSRFAPAIRVVGVLDNLGIKDGALSKRIPSVVAGDHELLVVADNIPLPWTVTDDGRTRIEVGVRERTFVTLPARRQR